METELFEWFNNNRRLGALIVSFELKIKAGQIVRAQCEKEKKEFKFRASDGWLRKFLHRHNLVLRRATTSGRDLPKNCKLLLNINFFKYFQIQKQSHFK